ncbi:hypothetical protein SEVIR_1G299600v4 [Setaria viridis]|uniref:Uncharacterized protein n=1 Tax=Setaria viridis TaxID=4556 RepID=A0A4U6WEZ8_SETVI|nr:hypothetical protein SEVIR_1G299600v2 [Setaria viridis]
MGTTGAAASMAGAMMGVGGCIRSDARGWWWERESAAQGGGRRRSRDWSGRHAAAVGPSESLLDFSSFLFPFDITFVRKFLFQSFVYNFLFQLLFLFFVPKFLCAKFFFKVLTSMFVSKPFSPIFFYKFLEIAVYKSV